jgi:hypothetical protein
MLPIVRQEKARLRGEKAVDCAEDKGIFDFDIEPGTEMDFLPSGQFRLLNLVLQDPIVTDVAAEGWRECYQLSPATECGT